VAASAWSVFYSAKHRMGVASIGFSLSAGIMRMSLHKTSVSANLLTGFVSTFGSVSFMASGGGVNAEGQTLDSVTWSGAAGVETFDCANETYSPASSALTSVRDCALAA